MYRAIVCVAAGSMQGSAELNIINPWFRTYKGAEEFWLAKMYDIPCIESFKIYSHGKKWEDTRENKATLVGRMMDMRSRLKPYDNPNDVEHIMDTHLSLDAEYTDMCIAILQEEYYRKKKSNDRYNKLMRFVDPNS